MDKAQDLINTLEPGQITSAAMKPLPRRSLGRGALFMLVLLRFYIIVAVPIVGYAFVHAMLNTSH